MRARKRQTVSGTATARIAEIARRSRAAFRGHPWMLRHADESHGEGGPNGMRHFESLAAVASTGLDVAGRLELVTMVDDYVYGFSVRESAVSEAGSFDGIPDALSSTSSACSRPASTRTSPSSRPATCARRSLRSWARCPTRTASSAASSALLDGIALHVERTPAVRSRSGPG